MIALPYKTPNTCDLLLGCRRWLGPDSNDADAAEAHVHLPHVSCSFWGYLYSRGPRRNWQRALRVSGRWWWLRWWLPAAAVRWDAAGSDVAEAWS